MGRDILAAGTLGVLMVVLVTVFHGPAGRLFGWPRRYIRARGYEAELARHTAAGLRAELDATGHGPVTYGTVAYAPVSGRPPWGPLTGQWLSELEANGQPVPAWAAPEADRYSGYGGNSGSCGSDYHGGELPTAGEGGAPGSGAMGGPGSEPYGVTGPAAYPFGRAPEDTALDETWARLERAWAHEGSAGIPQPARDSDSGAVERGREDDGSTGTATREHGLGSPASASSTGAGGDRCYSPGSAPGPGWSMAAAAATVAPPGPGSRLATRFDAELAAECSRYIREQDKDVTEYLERLLGITW